MSFKVKVSVNRAELEALKDTPEARKKLRDCAEAALSFQEATCPVDTGDLVKSLAIEEQDGGRSLRVGSLDPPLEYSRYVEEGHRSRSGAWVPAQPFIRPSIDAAKRGLR